MIPDAECVKIVYEILEQLAIGDFRIKVCFYICIFRALDKWEYLMIIRDKICKFCIKPYVMTPELNRLDETVQMRCHNTWYP